MAKKSVYTLKLTAWQILAIEVALERQQKNGGFEGQSLEALIKLVNECEPK